MTIGIVAWAGYATFIRGTTSGPDFVSAVRLGEVSPASISSVEVVEPAFGHTPFTASEYDSLPRLRRIDDTASISRFLKLLRDSQPGRMQQNHPATTYHVYLKVVCQDSFFWLYIELHEDTQGTVLALRANSRNAVNPNGASVYHLDNYAGVLTLLRG
jgi:hypothetical protein